MAVRRHAQNEGPRTSLSVLGIALAGGLALLVVSSVVVGFVGPRRGFDWTLASVFGTAVGTTLLAAATGALAFTTWTDVRATWRLAELAQQDRDARERPVVILSGISFSGSANSGEVRVVLFNAGLAPALRVRVTVRYRDEERPLEASLVIPAIRPEAAGEHTFPVSFADNPPPGGVTGTWDLSGDYTDRDQRNEYNIITDFT